MIFGGLEIVAGGYFAHKYYKNKTEKRRLEEESYHRRNNTFPNNKPSSYPLQPQFQHQEQRLQDHPQQRTSPQQYACYASMPCQSRQQHQAELRPQQLRPKPSHAQSFTIPRRPVPERKPEIIIQPGLQRADSMATLSRMPIANGYRPSNQAKPILPARYQTNGLSPTQPSPYGNVAFSVSSPAFGATPTSPPIPHAMVPERGTGRVMIDDNGETNAHEARYSAYAPTEASTQLGEQDPPPPYVQ